MQHTPTVRKPIIVLTALALVVSWAPVVNAATDVEKNLVWGANNWLNIYSANTASQISYGQQIRTNSFVTESTFQLARIDHIAVRMSKAQATISGDICLRVRTPGSLVAVASECWVANSKLPTVDSWVDFWPRPYFHFSAGSELEYWLDYTGTCTTCVRVYHATNDAYRPGDRSMVKQIGTNQNPSFQILGGWDLPFLFYVDHTAVLKIGGAFGSTTDMGITNTNGASIKFKGTNAADSGWAPSAWVQYGPTLAYGSSTGSFFCGVGASCEITQGGLPQHANLNWVLCGNNVAGTQCSANKVFTTGNAIPGTPSTPTGISCGRPGVSYGFSTSSTDFQDTVKYGWDWSEQGNVPDQYDPGAGFTAAGVTRTMNHVFPNQATFTMKVRAEDSGNPSLISAFSGTKSVTIDGTVPSHPNIGSLTHPEGQWVSNNDPTFQWTETDTGGCNILGSSHRLDGGGNSAYTPHNSFPYTNLAEGDHTFFVTVQDNAGNLNSDSYNFKIDTNPPSLALPVIDSGTLGQNGWHTTNVGLRIDSQDAASGVNCEAHSTSPGAGYSACVVADTWTVTAEGASTYYGRAEDNSSPRGIREGQDSVSFKIDRTPPSITDAQPDVSWTTDNPLLNVDFGDAVSGIWKIEYAVHSGAGQTGTQLKPWTQFFSTTSDGTLSYTLNWQADSNSFVQGNNYVSARVTDRAGNLVTLPDVALIQWDTVAPTKADPTVSGGTAGDNGWYVTPVPLVIDSADVTSGVAEEFHSDVGPAGPWSGGGADDAWTDASEGTDNWYGRAIDAAGNEYVSSGFPLKIDTTAPVSDVDLTGTLGTGGWYSSNVVATISAQDTVSGVASLRYKLDDGAWTTIPGTSDTVPIVGEGVHTLLYFSRDLAGNTDGTEAEPNSLTVRIDLTPPVTTHSITGTLGLSDWYTSSVTVTATSTDSASGPGQVWIQLDAGSWQSVSGSSASVIASAQGNHTVNYYSVDAAGNPDGSQTSPHTVTFKIDKIPPSTTDSQQGTVGGGGWFRSPVTVTLLPTDDLSGVLDTRYGLNACITTPTVYTAPFVISLEGSTQLCYRSRDQAGNVETTVSKTVKIDTIAPVFSSWSQTPANVNAGTAGAVTVNVNVDGGPSLHGFSEARYSYDGGFVWSPWTPTTGSGSSRQFSIPQPTVESQSGWWLFKESTLVYEVRATDVAGNLNSSVRSDTIERVAPVVAVQAPTAGANWNGIRNIQWTGRDADHDTVTYTVRLSPDGGATWPTTLFTTTVEETGATNTYTYSLDTNTLADGSNYGIRVDANDGLNLVTIPVMPIRIDNVIPDVTLVAPVFGHLTAQNTDVGPDPEGKTRVVGTLVTLKATATDPGPQAAGIQEVRFFVDGLHIGTDNVPDANGQYTFNWNLLGVTGDHVVSVQSFDKATNPSTPKVRTVTVIVDL